MKSNQLVHYFAALAGITGFLSCSDANQSSADSPDQNTKVPYDSLAIHRPLNNQITENKEFNYSSAINYALSVDSLKMWGLLCDYSKWGKQVHNGSYTLLCPPLYKLKSVEKAVLLALKDKNNLDILNQFMAAHLLKTDYSASKWKKGDVIETIDGRRYTVGNQEIGGLVYYTYDIATQHGNVVYVENMFSFPEKELRARMDKK